MKVRLFILKLVIDIEDRCGLAENGSILSEIPVTFSI